MVYTVTGQYYIRYSKECIKLGRWAPDRGVALSSLLSWLVQNESTRNGPNVTDIRQWAAPFPQNCLFPWEIWTPHLTHCVSKNAPPLTCYT